MPERVGVECHHRRTHGHPAAMGVIGKGQASLRSEMRSQSSAFTRVSHGV